MEITALHQLLLTNHQRFAEYIRSLSDEQFLLERNGKWTPAQQLHHIVRSVQPVNLAFGLPAFLPRLLFGKANRASRTYENLIAKYHDKLAAGGRASGRFVPPPTNLQQREKLLENLDKQVRQLTHKVANYPESKLDVLLLPHPLLGKLTLREMLYFTAYHVEHHERAISQNVGV